MALTLDTNHPLYANILACIGVDTDGTTIVDAKGAQTLTPHANVTRSTGTYGRHFHTNLISNNAEGVAMSPGVLTMGTATNAGTVFVVINSGSSIGNRGSVFNTAQQNGPMGPAVKSGDVVCITSNTTSATTSGTTDVIGTGAHSFAVGGNSNTNGRIWVDGVLENSPSSGVGNANNNLSTYIGGNSTGGFGGLSADYVWIVVFNKLLSDAEVASLHSSLGANNQFGLLLNPNMTAAVSAACSVSATLTTGINLVANAFGVATVTANLTNNGFSANAVSTVTLSAALTTAIVLNSSAAASTTATASLTTTPLVGFSTPPLKNNTGTLLANETGVIVNVYNSSTGALVAHKTGLTSDASGIVLVKDLGMVLGTTYAYEVVLTSNGRRLPTAQAA